MRLPGLFLYLPKTQKLLMMQLEQTPLKNRSIETVQRTNSLLERVRLRGTSEDESEPLDIY